MMYRQLAALLNFYVDTFPGHRHMQKECRFFIVLFLFNVPFFLNSRVANSDWTLYIQYYTVFSELIPRWAMLGAGWTGQVFWGGVGDGMGLRRVMNDILGDGWMDG
jgi:hypothetical protein